MRRFLVRFIDLYKDIVVSDNIKTTYKMNVRPRLIKIDSLDNLFIFFLLEVAIPIGIWVYIYIYIYIINK